MSDSLLVPVDFSPSSEAALRWALEYARVTGARVELLHVVHEPNPAYEVVARGDLLQTLEEAAHTAIDAFAERVCAAAGPDVAVTRTVVVGTPASRIVEFVEAGGFQHVVMGAHGRNGLGESLLGSKAERVCRLSRVPVTIVKA